MSPFHVKDKDVPLTPDEWVKSLRGRQRTWASRGIRSRIELAKRFRPLLVDASETIAGKEGERSGRTAAEVLASELLPLADACRFLEKNAGKVLQPRRVGLLGSPLWLVGSNSQVLREPHGVVLIIAPSNYPLLLPGVQVLQALVAGNAVILKPGVGGLEPARSLVSLLQTAGLPEGLLELLPEDPAPARAVMDAGVDKVFFTGSHTTGATVLSQLAKRVTASTMELSGCDAAIVRADADLGLAVRALTFGLRLNKGRTCIAPKRVFVARSIATEFEGRLAQALAVEPIHLLQGETQTRLRPIALQAIANGAHLLQGSINVDGTITLPLVFGGVRPSSRLLCEDFFAPVLSVVTVAEDAEAVSLANQCPYALGATVFTRDEREGVNLARQLRAGGVLINDMIAGTADPRLPFGGTGASGFGSTRGPEGLLEMTFPKVVTVRGGTWRMHFDPVGAEDLPLFHGLLRLAHGSSWTQKWRGIRELIGAVKNRTKK